MERLNAEYAQQRDPASESERGSLSILYSTTPPGETYSSASEGVCLKSGYIILESQTGRRGAYKTICKSWRCVVCRKKLMALFIERVKLGSLTLGPLYFITFTWWQDGPQTLMDAKSAEADWRAFLKALRRDHLPNLEYMKIPELTKAGQVHFHTLIGGIGEPQGNCREGAAFNAVRHLNGCPLPSDCLEHLVSRYWLAATNTSFVVFVEKVWDIKGLCWYLAKYMMKGFEDWQVGEAGFGKRWTRSHKWPKLPKMQLRGTLNKSWKKVDILKPTDQGVTLAHYLLPLTPTDGDFERLGDELAVQMDREKQANRLYKIIAEVRRNDHS